MKILCDKKAKEEVLDYLGLIPSEEETVSIRGYECIHESDRSFHFTENADNTEEFLLLSLTQEDVWELDKLQSNLRYRKKRVERNGQELTETQREDCFVYEKRKGGFEASEFHSIEMLRDCKNRNLQLDQCDIYLMIPGKLEKGKGVWEALDEKQRDVFDVFSRYITKCVNEEYNSEFAKSLERKCIGEVTIEIREYDCTYYQDAMIGIVRHTTGICILEIIVQNCAVGGNKLLSHYCADDFSLIFENENYTLAELLKKLRIRKYGKKRSMVFSYGETTDEEIINALANEENPMARIRGEFERKVESGNIAQYDTAKVYVSEETMFEKCFSMDVFGNRRLSYDAIEIFFVELILFQDAAVDKVYKDLDKEREKQDSDQRVEESAARCDEISFDMALAIRFADYEQFKFPTVRLSARNVAARFGIDKIFEKYQMNKSLLESMIRANRRKLQERQDNIKNRFLFLLSAVAAVGTCGDIVYVLYQDRVGAGLSYLVSTGMVAFIYLIYRVVMRFMNCAEKK